MLKESEKLAELLRDEGKEVIPYLVGRKAVGFYKFRRREFAQEWSGFSDNPKFEIARDAATKVAGELKPGAKVTVYYHMVAEEVESKGQTPAKAPKSK